MVKTGHSFWIRDNYPEFVEGILHGNNSKILPPPFQKFGMIVSDPLLVIPMRELVKKSCGLREMKGNPSNRKKNETNQKSFG